MGKSTDRMSAMQIGLNSCDIVASARLFAELGFHNAGGHMVWGGPMEIQGLNPSARGIMWWLVGRQEFVQLELFNHTNPPQRPLRADWRCCDLGWTRFGILVVSLARAKETLARWDIPIAGESSLPGDAKRLAFREPFIGCFVELFEDSEKVPGGSRPSHHDLEPALVYATSSVSDLDSARSFYEDVLALEIATDIRIHGAEHEPLWQLAGAKSESFVVDAGGFLLEIVKYIDPVGRPRPADYRVTDQGMVNVAFGTRKREVAQKTIELVRQTGAHMSPLKAFGDACGVYVFEAERELELGAVPSSLDAAFGFLPADPFFGVAY